ncbi:dTDP-4-dehydrorhamnose 3,5-epimerase [Massilia glaciei]|uniref:dTDP-4-dehydrorhamnose 3,5-epimerase n=1 Tax=Massilia glaciei TaxID=1524097 RepID=A0A2U2HNC5_9BURK|nr:dTDP-4-dehydrorhamnose 3,5-epimerase [Massilia glaciei]PWF48915.1 dTDP-4-dehydrorhamnose 3,5-epimerase [Massilia glaciei]
MRTMGTAIPDVLIFEPELFGDEHNFFYESFHQRRFEQAVGAPTTFVQDNHSKYARNALRGLHYQIEQTQGKLVRVVAGEVFDVSVDLRRSSPSFGKWMGVSLSAENRRQLWIPPGFAHGFVVTSESAEFLYKMTDYYAPQHERIIRWDDPTLAIGWPPGLLPILSAKDSFGQLLADADTFP